MKKVLVVLSVCFLVSSVTPSLAQKLPGGKVTKGLLRSSGEAAVGRVSAEQAIKSVSPRMPITTYSVPKARRLVGEIPSGQAITLPEIWPANQFQSFPSSRGYQHQFDITPRGPVAIHNSVIMSPLVKKVTSRLLAMPNGAARNRLRNEAVSAALHGDATPEQIQQLVAVYKEDLKTLSSSFSQLPKTNLVGTLQIAKNNQHPSYQTVETARQALSSAATLGLLGTKDDAPALLEFYKQAAGSVFEDTAAVIAARGMLRQGAYKELEELAALTKAEGPFWQGVATLAEKRGLPLQIHPTATTAKPVPVKELSEFLAEGCVLNAWNAQVSREATEKWLAF